MTKNNQSKEITAEQFIDQYFKKIGVGGYVKPEQFWRLLTKKFGKLADEFGDCVEARENGQKVDPYVLKNQTVEFANAIAAQFDVAKLRSTALWFLREQFQLNNKMVLEVGCDTGILLCMIATLFPNTKFTGIDPCEPAIKIARERAKYLELANIEFQVATLDTFVDESNQNIFDLILSVTVFHELLADGLFDLSKTIMSDSNSTFSIEEADDEFIFKCVEINDLKFLTQLLSADGKCISVDRWGTQYDLLKWIRLNEKVGLCCSMSSSNMIRFKGSSGQPEILPLTVFYKGSKAPLLACDVLSFKAYPGFVDVTAYHLIEDMMVAEMIYGALTKEEIYFHECVYNDGSGTERLTMGVANGLGYVYTTATTGFRRLALIPSAVLYEKAHEMDEARGHAEKVASVKYHWGDPNLLSRLNIPLN
jgi:SAM-dependent methyltransferase